MTSLVQKKFGAAAADYATSTLHAEGESLARLIALIEPRSNWRVLDVATGAGHTALAFAPHVARSPQPMSRTRCWRKHANSRMCAGSTMSVPEMRRPKTCPSPT